MIGALSIVRFRNPVRNPFELVIFFALVTIGVAVSADPALGVALGIFVMFVVYGVAFYERIAGRNRRQPFAISFAEGETSHTISVSTRGRILLLDESLGLTSRFEDNSNDECSYTLSFRTRQELDEMSDSLRSVRPSVLSIETRIGQSPA